MEYKTVLAKIDKLSKVLATKGIRVETMMLGGHKRFMFSSRLPHSELYSFSLQLWDDSISVATVSSCFAEVTSYTCFTLDEIEELRCYVKENGYSLRILTNRAHCCYSNFLIGAIARD